jgi:hypothetical protein
MAKRRSREQIDVKIASNLEELGKKSKRPSYGNIKT